MDKKTEKQLKRPDAFQTSMYRAAKWLKASRQQVLLVLIPMVGLILLAGGWQYYRYLDTQKRRAQLAKISTASADEEKAFNKKQNELREEIRKLEAEVPKDAPKDAPHPKKAAIDAKKKELDGMVLNHDKTLELYLAFFNSNQKNPEGWRAGIAAANDYIAKKKLAEAAPILETILANSLGTDFYQVQVRFMYMAILEDLKKYQEALAESEKLMALASEDLQPKVLLFQARLQKSLGKREESLKTLDLVIKNHSSTPEAREALATKVL